MPRLVDLSHVVSAGLVTYPGLPAPEVTAHLSFDESHAVYAAGYEFTIARVSMIANTGTYLDTPAHRFRDGWDLGRLELERCANLPAVVLDAPDRGEIGRDVLDGVDVRGAAVLLRTGWDTHWGDPAYGDPAHPYLGEEAAAQLIAGGAVLVGIDAVNIDPTVDARRPIHTALLGADVLVVEHLTNLAALPPRGATFTAAPVAFAGVATFPVRAFAVVPE